MRALVVVTFVALGVLVATLAATLLVIVGLLWRIRETAGLILFGVRAIAERAEPVGPVVGEINRDLTAVLDGLGAVLAKHGAAPPAEEPEVVQQAMARGTEPERGHPLEPASRAAPRSPGGGGDA